MADPRTKIARMWGRQNAGSHQGLFATEAFPAGRAKSVRETAFREASDTSDIAQDRRLQLMTVFLLDNSL